MVLGLGSIASGQVNMQTGSATFSVPIANWQDTRSRLYDVASLDYSSGGGLRVNAVATNVGQGWQLMLGGVITRMQVGEPDDQEPRSGLYDDVSKYPAGYLYNPADINLGCPEGISYFPIFDHANQVYSPHIGLTADREKDFFSFQFNGRNGTFVLGKTGGDIGLVVGDSKLKIWFDRSEAMAAQELSRTVISAFHIQDENGIIYTFSKIGKTKLLNVHFFNPGYPNPIPQPDFANGQVYHETSFDEIPTDDRPFIINSWYLTNVQDPMANRSITFNYEVRSIVSNDGNDIRACSSSSTTSRYAIITHKVSNTSTPYITSVQYPDGHALTVNYDKLNQRVDLPGDYPVKSIDITYNGRYVSRYQLNTSYFILNGYGYPSAADKDKARLCLRSVVKYDADLKGNEPPYVFDYYTGSTAQGDFVPPPFYYFNDIMGYYNAGLTNSFLASQTPAVPFSGVTVNDLSYNQLGSLCFIGSSDPSNLQLPANTFNSNFAKNGLLKSITLPMGGKTSFEYEPNVVSVSNPTQKGGVHVSKVTTVDGGYSNGDNNALTTTYKYINEDQDVSSQWGVDPPDNVLFAKYYYTPEGSHHTIFNGCQFDYTYTGILSRTDFQDIVSQNKPILQTISQVVQVATYGYDVYLLVTGNPISLIVDAIGAIIDIITECGSNYTQQGSNMMRFNYDVYNRNPLPAQFGRVEVAHQGEGGSGKTVYEFTTDADYGIWDSYLYFTPPQLKSQLGASIFSMRQRAAPWAYGLPKRITMYGADNKKIKQTENVYDWSTARSITSQESSCNCEVDQSVSMRSPLWMQYDNTPGLTYLHDPVLYTDPDYPANSAYRLKVDVYLIYSGRVQVKDVYERTFKQGDDSRYAEVHTHYDYNYANYQVKKATVTQSNGDQYISETTYPGDYTSGGVLQTLTSNNLINLPVGVFKSVIRNNSQTQSYLGASITQYGTAPDGEIKPMSIYTGLSTQPVTTYSFDPSNPLSYPNLKQTKTFGYDGNGSLVKLQDGGGRNITNLYDYDNSLLVASVVNADPVLDQVAYSSFETSSTGNWVVNGGALFTNPGMTGDRAFALNMRVPGTVNSLSTNVVINKPYILSFWAYQFSNIIVGGDATLTRSGPSYNGFTYYEYSIPAGGYAPTLRGNAVIDELRLYPADARMKTKTYDPLLGMTSECDENNRIVYYEYDELGKVRFVKDERKNVLKMYEYNVRQGQLPDVPVVVPYPSYPIATITYDNVYLDNSGDVRGDVVVHFWSDAACTKPVWVNNITVNFMSTSECTNGVGGGGGYGSAVVSGTSAILGTDVLLRQTSQDETPIISCTYTYSLTGGNYLLP